MKKKKKPKKKVVRKKKVSRKSAKKKVVRKKKKTARPKKKSAIAAAMAQGVTLEEIGVVTHYFPHVEAAVVKMTKGSLAIGDTILIKGHTSDFKDKVGSIQLEHEPIQSASIGQEIGLKVKSKVREHDIVYKVVS